MTRPIAAAMLADIAAARGELTFFIELAFSETTLYLCTAAQDLDWDGHTWVGVGGAVAFEPITESGDLSASGTTLVTAGVDQSIIGVLLQQDYIGRRASVWQAHLDPATGLVIDAPLEVFRGYMNGGWEVQEERPTSVSSPGTVSVRLRCSDPLSQLDQRRGIQTNPGSHGAAIGAADKFFDYVGQLSGVNVVWKK